ncbi:CAP domain-containing protein [Pelosinus sp. sgz500959]|uniref:CAP domain-containing protein n=1 Tax=Pelosinus sp. sgz500959 TaxID=3242472 RepID=UPI0036731FC4
MRYSKCSSLVALSFLTVSLITTSFGGAFATAALAATPEVSSQEVKNDDNKGLVAGIAAIGLISLLSNHGGDKAGTVPAKTSTTTSTSGNSTGTTTTPAASNSNLAADEKLAFDLLNADRASNGLKALKFNSQLTNLGEKYAQDMINRNFFAHTNPEGQSPFDRMQQAGISYNSAGENIAINSNVTAAEKAFMNSSGHRANILNTGYTEVGIGVRYDAKGSAYVVQEFIGK